MERLTCVVVKAEGTSVWGKTPDRKFVVMKACAEGLRGVRIGDTVAFCAKPFRVKPEFEFKNPHNPAFFGSWPCIIERAPQNNPVAWKKRQDSSADHKAFQEAMAGEPLHAIAQT